MTEPRTLHQTLRRTMQRTRRRPLDERPANRTRPAVRRGRLALVTAAAAVAVTACSAGADTGAAGAGTASTSAAAVDVADWPAVQAAARGQEVSLWMWGGDAQGNAYVDDVLAPAAARLGVKLRRVPVADTADALTRMLAEHRAGTKDGAVDLVWVNGENFRTGVQAGLWRCGWAGELPSARYVDPQDPLLVNDFGTPVNGCEVGWHKAQFVLAYDAAQVPDPPATLAGVLAWAKANPGRFTYPAPPDFTGSAFVRQALYATAGGPAALPTTYDEAAAGRATDALWRALDDVAPNLWRGGDTYPRDVDALNDLYAGKQVAFTMTYGPATLDALVRKGTFPTTTKVLPLAGGTLGNASFLAIPANAAHAAGALVVADLALSPEQQLAKADPRTWGQYTVLDLSRLPADLRARFAAVAPSAVVPSFDVLSKDALPELSATWVGPLEEGWRREVLGAP